MKLTKDRLKQIIKEELEEIVGQVSPQPNAPDGQENEQQKRILDMFNTVEEIAPAVGSPLKFNVVSPTTVQVIGKISIRLQGRPDVIDIPLDAKLKASDITSQNLQQFYASSLGPAALASIENLYNKKYGLINKLPYNKMLTAWRKGSSRGTDAVANFLDLQKQVKSKQSQPAPQQQTVAPAQQAQQPKPPGAPVQERKRR